MHWMRCPTSNSPTRWRHCQSNSGWLFTTAISQDSGAEISPRSWRAAKAPSCHVCTEGANDYEPSCEPHTNGHEYQYDGDYAVPVSMIALVARPAAVVRYVLQFSARLIGHRGDWLARYWAKWRTLETSTRRVRFDRVDGVNTAHGFHRSRFPVFSFMGVPVFAQLRGCFRGQGPRNSSPLSSTQ